MFGAKHCGVEGIQSVKLHQVYRTRMPKHPSPVVLQQDD
jgi:hypothetical protein